MTVIAFRKPGSPSLSPLKLLPTIELHGAVLTVNGMSVDLSERPTTVKLVACYVRSPHKILSKATLISAVYPNLDLERKSERYQKSVFQNLTKLVSRTRRELSKKFNTGSVSWIEFFPHDTEAESWSFYHLTNSYLLEIEQQTNRNSESEASVGF